MSYLLTELNDFEKEVREERGRQNEKWGVQDHPNGTGGLTSKIVADFARDACQIAAARGVVTWSLILQEEIAEAFAEKDERRLYDELTQAEAVIRQWRECLRRKWSAEAEAVRAGVREKVAYECRYLDTPCHVCDHKGCGFCPDCSPEVPDL